MADSDPRLTAAVDQLLGVAEQAMATADPVSLLKALGATAAGLPRHPRATAAVVGRLGQGLAGLVGATTRCALGKVPTAPVPPRPGDRRFLDPAFAQNPYFFALAQAHLLAERCASELVDAAALPAGQARKASFALKFVLDALAPTNMPAGNPAAARAAFDTGGKSAVRGLQNLWGDLRHNGGWPSQVDASGFEVGVNIAATKGQVVYRNDLIELIQYQPETTEVHEIPLLFCPPWINKYYVMDLAPGKSLIEWSLRHGHTCFAISYRNADASMRDVGFEDYLFRGPLAAIEVVREITGAPRVNLLSVCLGGTLSAIALAYLAREGISTVNSATFLNSHTDFSLPGLLGIFVDEPTIAKLERKMSRTGYLDAAAMTRTFDLLRANDLIFSYVANGWLMGKQPAAFDLLAWNADSTRMPAKMQSRYLRSCYLENEFARGEFVVAGAPVDPAATDVETYVLSAVDDHLVPWPSAYRTTQLLGGDSRFVLSTSGHIAGIINPPSPKAKHWTNEDLPVDPQQWKQGAELHDETWWEDWSRWLGVRAGSLVRPPEALGSRDHPPIEDAPGSYVRTRSA